MYAVYCRLNGRYDRLDTFRTLGEASALADKLRRQQSADSECLYYVIGPGLPTPAGLVTSPKRPVARQPDQQRAPKRGLVRRITRRFRRPNKQPSATPQQRDRADGNRHGDLSLFVRPEEEIGLGIPAQTDKGRRNRKGWYIP